MIEDFIRIKIAIREAEDALTDKKKLDAFCFALKIKMKFRSSDLHYDSLTKAAELMGLNKIKFKEYFEAALSYGYIYKTVSTKGTIRYVARKMHTPKDYIYKVREDDLKNLSMTEMRTLVRRIVIENRLVVIEDTSNTHEKACSGDNKKEIISCRKREKRMLNKEFNKDYTGCSIENIKKIANCTTYEARKIINNLVSRNIVKKIARVTTIIATLAVCSYTHVERTYDNSLVIFSAKSKNAFVRQSNTFNVLNSAISKAK